MSIPWPNGRRVWIKHFLRVAARSRRELLPDRDGNRRSSMFIPSNLARLLQLAFQLLRKWAIVDFWR